MRDSNLTEFSVWGGLPLLCRSRRRQYSAVLVVAITLPCSSQLICLPSSSPQLPCRPKHFFAAIFFTANAKKRNIITESTFLRPPRPTGPFSAKYSAFAAILRPQLPCRSLRLSEISWQKATGANRGQWSILGQIQPFCHHPSRLTQLQTPQQNIIAESTFLRPFFHGSGKEAKYHRRKHFSRPLGILYIIVMIYHIIALIMIQLGLALPQFHRRCTPRWEWCHLDGTPLRRDWNRTSCQRGDIPSSRRRLGHRWVVRRCRA